VSARDLDVGSSWSRALAEVGLEVSFVAIVVEWKRSDETNDLAIVR